MKRFLIAIGCSLALFSFIPSGEENDDLYVASVNLEDNNVMERSQLISSVLHDGYDLWAKVDSDSTYIWLYESNKWVRENRSIVESLKPVEEFFKGQWYVLHGGDTVFMHSTLTTFVLPNNIGEKYFVIDNVKGDTVVLTPITCPYNYDGDIIEYKRIESQPIYEHIWKNGLEIKKGHLIFD
jgi:hypothetical protein